MATVDWTALGAIGQLAAAVVGSLALWQSVKVAKEAKALAAQAQMREEAVRKGSIAPFLHLGDPNVEGGMGEFKLSFVIYNIGVGPALDLTVEALPDQSDYAPDLPDLKRHVRLLSASGPNGTAGEWDKTPNLLPWTTSMSFRFINRHGKLFIPHVSRFRFTWKDREGNQFEMIKTFSIPANRSEEWID